jgi:hypothetical protein
LLICSIAPPPTYQISVSLVSRGLCVCVSLFLSLELVDTSPNQFPTMQNKLRETRILVCAKSNSSISKMQRFGLSTKHHMILQQQTHQLLGGSSWEANLSCRDCLRGTNSHHHRHCCCYKPKKKISARRRKWIVEGNAPPPPTNTQPSTPNNLREIYSSCLLLLLN